MPLFSIITPTYQAAAGLRATIESVLAQDPTLFEYLIVDGGSTDDTVEIIDRYSDHLRWISENDQGIYDAMNKGIELSSGRYLYFIGAGDILNPGVLTSVAANVPDHDRGLVYGSFHLRDDKTEYYGEVSKWFLLLIYNICHQSAFYGRELFEYLGRYDLRYPVRADYAINVEAFCDSTIEKRYIDLVIADYEGGGISQSDEDEVFVRDFPALARRCLGVNRLIAPEPFFSLVMRLKFSASLRAFGRRVFQAYAAVKKLV